MRKGMSPIVFGMGATLLLVLGLLWSTGISTTFNRDVGPPVVSADAGNDEDNHDNELTTSTVFSGDVTGTFDAMVVLDDSHDYGRFDCFACSLDK